MTIRKKPTESSGAKSRKKLISTSLGVGPYALNELPQPHVVFACGFLIANPDPWILST
jgi:hypothetical protein